MPGFNPHKISQTSTNITGINTSVPPPDSHQLGGDPITIPKGTDLGSLVAPAQNLYDPHGIKANTPKVAEVNPAALQQVNANKYQTALQGQSAPQATAAQMQAANINMAPQDQFRQQQLALASQLAGQASGTGPSITGMQGAQSQEAALAASRAQLASARGGANPALARQAMQQNAQTQQQIAQQTQIARLQEQMQAAGMLGNVAGQARGADIGLAQNQAELQQQAAGQNAGFQQQTGLANQAAQENFQGLQQKYMTMGLSAEQANQQAALEFEKMKQNQAAMQTQAEMGTEQVNRNILGGALGGGFGAITQIWGGKGGGGGQQSGG